MNKYKCKICGYIHEGNKAPDICPLCKAPSSEFELIKEKKGLNTSSNGYTIMYAAIMVILVAAALAFTAQTLKEKQQINVAVDKKIQILSSLKVPADNKNAEALYESHIKQAVVINNSGEIVSEGGFEIDIPTEFKKPAESRLLPVFICSMDGVTRYVLPVYGAGLWGPVWGFVCLNEDMNTVFGAFFSHKGETPGLGAEIEKPVFQEQFVGKNLFKEGEFRSIAIMKKGQKALNGEDQVDALSGGTITSKGVEEMLFKSLEPYKAYMKKISQVTPLTTDSVVVATTDSISIN